MVSAVSRVVERTDVKSAINSSTSPPAALNAPPARLIATPISDASTAKFAATVLIFPSKPSNWLLASPNCLIAATAVSAVSAILSNVGANSVLANACIAISVSLTERPVCFKIRPTLTNEEDDTPRDVAKPLTVLSRPLSCCIVWPET